MIYHQNLVQFGFFNQPIQYPDVFAAVLDIFTQILRRLLRREDHVPHGRGPLQVAATVAIGAYAGAVLGTKIAARTNASALKRYMSVVFFIIAIIMVLKAGGYM